MSGELAPWLADRLLSDSINDEYDLNSGIWMFRRSRSVFTMRSKTNQNTIDDHISKHVDGSITSEYDSAINKIEMD